MIVFFFLDETVGVGGDGGGVCFYLLDITPCLTVDGYPNYQALGSLEKRQR